MNVQPARQPKLRQTEYGPERRCSKCGEYWPADDEFFHRCRTGLASACKACTAESRKSRARP